jgi:16S rRNA (guanine527-N7)-methyltransferase
MTTVDSPLTRADFAAVHDVSHETLDRLQTYVDLLARWNPRINLVSAATLADPWRRHVWDSAQLMPDLDGATGGIADLGSGAGLPGMVLAILGCRGVVLLESDQRKCAFLRTVAREAEVAVAIQEGRMETLPPVGAGMVTARACAPLARLLEYAERHRRPDGHALFLKGRSAEHEIAEARRSWRFDVRRRASRTDPEGCVLRLENIARA